MIVVDTNILAYYFLPGEFTPLMDELKTKDSGWISTPLWRFEFRSVLAQYLRKNLLSFEGAMEIQRKANQIMAGSDRQAPENLVLELVSQSNCSSYDCEFVALAKHLGIPLVTTDRQVLAHFPKIAIHPGAIG